MSNKEILNSLAILEAAFYYRIDGSDDAEGISRRDLEDVHNTINQALVDWHRITGCELD